MASSLDNFKTRPLTSSAYINGIYIPSALLIVGTLIIKSEWVGYAVALSLMLSGWKIFNNEPKTVLNPKIQQSFPLESKTILSHNTAIYRFSLPTKTSILGLPTGQHIAIHAAIPWSANPSKPLQRFYTPISSDHNPGYFDLLIKAYPTGNISKLIAQLPIGGLLTVSGPKGAMRYERGLVRRFGMIAGGSGITPMLQIMREIQRGRASGDTTEVDLIFANVTEADILLKEDLDALAAQDPGIRVHYVLNEPPRDKEWEGGVGFVDREMLHRWLPAPAKDIKVLVCGPPPMVVAMRKLTEEMGYEKARAASKLEDQVFCF